MNLYYLRAIAAITASAKNNKKQTIVPTKHFTLDL